MNFERFTGNSEELGNRDREKVVDIILAEKEKRPDPLNFASIYGEAKVKKDSDLAKQLKAKFDAQDAAHPEKLRGHRFSTAFERIFKSWAPNLKWFGEGTEIIPTSEYDDYVNGVDGVLGLRGPEYVALAIDTTHAGEDKIEEKMIRNLDRILGKPDRITGEKGPLVLKYFERKNFRGQLKESIPVVIGLDNQHVNQIIDTFGQVFNLLKQKSKTPRQNEILAEKIAVLKSHPAQLVFLKEIRLQLAMYKRVLEKNNTDDEQIESIKTHVNEILQLISTIILEKSDIELGELENDRALAIIQAFCEAQK